MPFFQRYIGIDYSGAAEPTKPSPGLQVAVAGQPNDEPILEGAGWSRKKLASWLLEQLLSTDRVIAGIDYAFSYPVEAMDQATCGSWDRFLAWFETRWPTRERAVRGYIAKNLEHLQRHRHCLRLTDRWTSSAMPIFKGWEAKGPTVFFSTHAGIPWLRWLRNEAEGRIHFWPFDGFEIPPEKSVLAEVYPRLFRRRYQWDSNLSDDERDAWLVCQWLKDRDTRGRLLPYFTPPLDEAEARQARLEGWILGVA